MNRNLPYLGMPIRGNPLRWDKERDGYVATRDIDTGEELWFDMAGISGHNIIPDNDLAGEIVTL